VLTRKTPSTMNPKVLSASLPDIFPEKKELINPKVLSAFLLDIFSINKELLIPKVLSASLPNIFPEKGAIESENAERSLPDIFLKKELLNLKKSASILKFSLKKGAVESESALRFPF
jgi:hypothetical protein